MLFSGRDHFPFFHVHCIKCLDFIVYICNYTPLCLCSLVEDCPQGLKDCKDPALGLEEFLKQRSRELHGKEESQVGLDLDIQDLKTGVRCQLL